MTVPILFAAFMLMSMSFTLVDWRRGWLMAILCGVLQDPARKLTAGTPVIMSISIVAIYVAVLFAGQAVLQREGREFSRRFSSLFGTLIFFFIFLFLAAINGLFTFGIDQWKAPAMSFFLYLAPMPAVIIGYAFLQREEQLYDVFKFYSVVTAIAMIGTPLEYFRVPWRALGTVALSENIRFITGFNIRMLSGLYRGPDIMGWHAALLTMIGIIMTVRRRSFRSSWIWMLVTGWGFLNCMISGRRKAIYMIVVFVVAFLWRYFRQLSFAQAVSFGLLGIVVIFVITRISQDEESSVYTRGAYTTQEEIWDRLEGGLGVTIEQAGIMGAGLGTATQGVYHVLREDSATTLGWQEGGLGKLAIELGVPGLLSVALLGLTMILTMVKISGHPDVPGSSQLARAALFGIIASNVVEFMVSAQAYSDPVLTLLTAFFIGCMFATAALDDRLAAEKAVTVAAAPSTARLTAPVIA
ncbi:MAG: hypothetical protein JO093_21325 [Acidobacteria bacterium]|nr:hypothetical protein [Acidobacteriota bacterium]MBV9071326.1 hypothetical protein [Acidobacteriota bacterium]MBV9188165.1 hypothetical protein [Acidobacteriota bacterium]